MSRTGSAPRGGLVTLCVTVTTSWGLLYYSLPVAAQPINDATGWGQGVITAAFSVGLLVSAAVGIVAGRMLDRRGPRVTMSVGSVLGVLGLIFVGAAPNLTIFFAAWAFTGIAQALVLYQPAFAVITRWYGDARVRPLTILTLVGGLASTIFAPIVAVLVEELGWRYAYGAMAILLAVITIPAHLVFLRSTWQTPQVVSARSQRADVRRVTRSGRFVLLQLVMAALTLAMFAVTINVIPLLVERGFSYRAAAVTLGLVGAGQVVGRLGYTLLPHRRGPGVTTMIIGLAGAVSLGLLAVLPGPAWALVAAGILAGGARGCQTLLQATAVADRWGTDNFGTVNGIFAAPMTAVGALGPAAGAMLATAVGGFGGMAMIMAGITAVGAAAALKT